MRGLASSQDAGPPWQFLDWPRDPRVNLGFITLLQMPDFAIWEGQLYRGQSASVMESYHFTPQSPMFLDPLAQFMFSLPRSQDPDLIL